MKIIEYLNANQGFVMAILTAVYVLATIVLVLLAQRQAALSKKNLEFASNAEVAKYRPYLIFDIVYEEVVAYARLRNSGVSPAVEVKLEISPRLKFKDKDHGVGFVEKGVSFLAPARELSQPFGWTKEFFDEYPELKFLGSISYKDAEGRGYSEKFAIDLGYLKDMVYIGKIDVGRELEGVKKALEKFHAGGFVPLVRTIGELEYRDEQNRFREEQIKRFKEHESKSKPA